MIIKKYPPDWPKLLVLLPALIIFLMPNLLVNKPFKLFRSFSLNENFIYPEKPQGLSKDDILKRKWQNYVERIFLLKLGRTRAFLVLSYNELIHHLFKMNAKKDYIRSDYLGYYPVDTIKRLNNDVLSFDTTQQHYKRAAHRLRVLQDLLRNRGVSLLVIPAPPKIRLYPEHMDPYLVRKSDDIMKQAVSYGDILEEEGVNVLNVQHIFSQRKNDSPWPFFTETGFHWSFWAGCNVTQEILQKAAHLVGHPYFSLNCSKVVYKKAVLQDRDIAEILNILSKESIVKKAPFPIIKPHANNINYPYAINIIGDSFSDQITYALTHALPKTNWNPLWLTIYPYFSKKEVVMLDNTKHQLVWNEDKILPEILSKELLLLEVSDGAIPRDPSALNSMEFGATIFLLNKLLPSLQEGDINPAHFLTEGWHNLGQNRWTTTGNSASFVTRLPTELEKLELTLDIEQVAADEKIRTVKMAINGQKFHDVVLKPGRQQITLTIPKLLSDNVDPFLSEITFYDQNKPLNMILYHAAIGHEIRSVLQQDDPPKIVSHTLPNYIDLFSTDAYNYLDLEGFSTYESHGTESWLWGMGPRSAIRFYVESTNPQLKQFLLEIGFKNKIPSEENVSIRLNGKEIYFLASSEIDGYHKVNKALNITVQPGINVLELVYSDWNHHSKEFVSDPRHLAVGLTKFSLQAKQNDAKLVMARQ